MKLQPGVKVGRILPLTGEERKKYDELNEIWKSALSKHLDLVNRMQQAEIIFKGRIAERAWEMGWQSKGAIVYDQEQGRIVELLRDDEELFG